MFELNGEEAGVPFELARMSPAALLVAWSVAGLSAERCAFRSALVRGSFQNWAQWPADTPRV